MADWFKVAVLLWISMATLISCSTGTERRASTETEHAREMANAMGMPSGASLAQQGQFTRVALLRDLYNSSMFDVPSANQETFLATHTIPSTSEEQNIRRPVTYDISPKLQKLQKTTYSSMPGGDPSALDEQWHARLGWSLLIDGNYTGAAAAYREALRQDDSLAKAYLGLGMALNMLNDAPAAIEAYQHALKLQPDYAAAQVHLGSIYADGAPEYRDVEKAKQLYSRASQQGDPFAKIALQELKTR